MASDTPSGQKRTIVLTGASDGIGAIAARSLAGPDTDLVLVGRSAKKLAPIAAETGARQFTADFSALSEVRDLAAEINSAVGTIDVLMNNAGGRSTRRTARPTGTNPTSRSTTSRRSC